MIRVLLVSMLLALAGSGPDAQVLVPPGASLDVHVPSAPMPVRIGGRPHLAYELHITNFRTVDLALTRIDVLADRGAAPLASYQEAALRGGLARVGSRPDGSDTRVIGRGMRAVFFVWLALDESTPVPTSLRHRISFDVIAPAGREPGTVECCNVDVRRSAPIVLGPPLRGGPWVAVYDPDLVGGHRRALFSIDGKARIPARFAIDWIRLEADGYGADVLAVADAVVVDAVDKYPEPTSPISIDNAAGNAITLDVGGGRFVFYEHLKPGSVKVNVGDRVRSGQVLAALGASGSVSSGAHLHFHVADANSSLGAEGVPFVLQRFEILGAFESLDAFANHQPWKPASGAPAGERRLEMPRHQTVLRF